MVCVVKLIAKHLPLLALALLVSSTQLRADDFPLKVGDVVQVQFLDASCGEGFKITNVKGKWVEVEQWTFGVPQPLRWINTDNIISLVKTPKQ